MAWVVVENTPGYLPDSDPADFDEIEKATAYAESLADELEEDGYTVHGNDEKTLFYGERDSDDFGRVVEVMEIPDGVAEIL